MRTHEEKENDTAVPMLGSVAAGKPYLAYYDSPEYIESPVNADFALYANDDSMEPIIKYLDYIFVKSTPVLENGQIGIISIDGETTCKIFKQEKHKLILRSINPENEDLIYNLKEYKDYEYSPFKILGRVVLTPEQENLFKIYKR